MERGKEEVAFKDFKSSVTIGEFEAVLGIAKEEYDRLKKAFEAKEEFIKKSCRQMVETQLEGAQIPQGFEEKLSQGFERRAEKDFKRMLSKQLDRHRSVVDFINRFRDQEEKYSYLD